MRRDRDKSDLFGPSGSDYEHRKSEVVPPAASPPPTPGAPTCVVRTRFAPLLGAMMTHRSCLTCGYREYYHGAPYTPWKTCPNCQDGGPLHAITAYDPETTGMCEAPPGLPGAMETVQWCTACDHREQGPSSRVTKWKSCPKCGVRGDGTYTLTPPTSPREGVLDRILSEWCMKIAGVRP